MSNLDVCLSSKRNDWETPQWLFDELDKEFNFKLDVCALPHNAKCDCYFTPETNGLNQFWYPYGGSCWMNPPYGKEIGKWLKKAYQTAQLGYAVVCLVPARTDTKWWHEYAMKGEIRFIKGRLKFVGAKDPAPFPSAVVVFRPPKG